jgi:Tfp pilus assembly protein PilN
MDRVNLLPEDLRLTWKDSALWLVHRRFGSVLMSAVALTCLLEAWAAAHQGLRGRWYAQQTTVLEERRANLVAELENAQAYLAQLDQAEQRLQGQLQWLLQRIQYLQAYRQTKGEWATALQELKRALPHGVWLTRLDSGPDGALRLAGGAFSDTLVSEFMGELKAHPQFTNVAFNFTKKAAIGKTGIVEFELTCRFMATGDTSS